MIIAKNTLMMIGRLPNATSVIILPLLWQLWILIWKDTVEKSQTNAINAILHLHGQAIWGSIWKDILEKRYINANSATIHLVRQVIWRDIWRHIVKQLNKWMQCDFTSYLASNLGDLGRNLMHLNYLKHLSTILISLIHIWIRLIYLKCWIYHNHHIPVNNIRDLNICWVVSGPPHCCLQNKVT